MTDSIELSERLMRLGWWDEAAKVIDRQDVAPADRLLQDCTLTCRKECAEWFAAQQFDGEPSTSLFAQMFQRFDSYTANWVIHEYCGEGSMKWRRENARANGPTD